MEKNHINKKIRCKIQKNLITSKIDNIKSAK